MKLKWYTMSMVKPDKEEKALRRMVKRLNRFAKRHKMNYVELYVIENNGSRTINIRAKKNNMVTVNSYAFVK